MLVVRRVVGGLERLAQVRVDGAALEEVALHQPEQRGRRPLAAAAAARRRLLLRAPPKLLRERGGEREPLDVGLADGLDQVVHEHRRDQRRERKDAVVVHVGLPGRLEALGVHVDDGDVGHRARRRPQPHALRLRLPLVADHEPVGARDAHQRVEQEALAAAVRADRADDRHRPVQRPQPLQRPRLQHELGVRRVVGQRERQRLARRRRLGQRVRREKREQESSREERAAHRGPAAH